MAEKQWTLLFKLWSWLRANRPVSISQTLGQGQTRVPAHGPNCPTALARKLQVQGLMSTSSRMNTVPNLTDTPPNHSRLLKSHLKGRKEEAVLHGLYLTLQCNVATQQTVSNNWVKRHCTCDHTRLTVLLSLSALVAKEATPNYWRDFVHLNSQ